MCLCVCVCVCTMAGRRQSLLLIGEWPLPHHGTVAIENRVLTHVLAYLSSPCFAPCSALMYSPWSHAPKRWWRIRYHPLWWRR